MKHDDQYEWSEGSSIVGPACRCATRAYERDPLPEAPLATADFPPHVSNFGAPRGATS